MKILKLLLSALALVLVLSGCKRDNYEWPETVVFGKEGGKREVSSGFTAGDIRIYEENFAKDGIGGSLDSYLNESEVTFHYKWLTVKIFRKSMQSITFTYESIELEAEPNTTGSPRELTIQGTVMNSHYILQVKQDG